jgi:hypothetical protein
MTAHTAHTAPADSKAAKSAAFDLAAIEAAKRDGYREDEITGEVFNDYRRELADKVVGFAQDEETVIREAIESGRLSWQMEEGATWAEIAADARKAGILTFYRSWFGVLVTDEN